MVDIPSWDPKVEKGREISWVRVITTFFLVVFILFLIYTVVFYAVFSDFEAY